MTSANVSTPRKNSSHRSVAGRTDRPQVNIVHERRVDADDWQAADLEEVHPLVHQGTSTLCTRTKTRYDRGIAMASHLDDCRRSSDYRLTSHRQMPQDRFIGDSPEDKPNADAKFRFTRTETLYSSTYWTRGLHLRDTRRSVCGRALGQPRRSKHAAAEAAGEDAPPPPRAATARHAILIKHVESPIRPQRLRRQSGP